MIPQRFRNLRPYVASFIHSRFPRPSFSEMVRWCTQPGKEQRANKYIDHVVDEPGLKKIRFKDFDKPFYYPASARWIDLCQTIDECFNPSNWHHFITQNTPITAHDIVVDCGAAEGLFSYVAAFTAQKVYAVEPIPSWYPAMEKTFAEFPNVEVLKYGVGHKSSTMRMTNDEIYSKVAEAGNLEVQVETIDSLFADKTITFLKADIEGFEFPMLLGAEQVIRKNRPKIALTVYHDGNDFVEMKEYLKNIHKDYQFATRGIAGNGNPVLLLAF